MTEKRGTSLSPDFEQRPEPFTPEQGVEGALSESLHQHWQRLVVRAEQRHQISVRMTVAHVVRPKRQHAAREHFLHEQSQELPFGITLRPAEMEKAPRRTAGHRH